MNLTNFHSHCDYCDGRAPMEDFIIKAIESGFTAYGISSHAPVGFHTKWNMDIENLEFYMEDIQKLKTKYKEKIEIYSGLEIDYFNDEINPTNNIFKNIGLDYTIGSIHFVQETMETDAPFETFNENLKKIYNGDLHSLCDDYFDASMKMVETGGFDILGHCDKISMNAEKHTPGITSTKSFYNRVKELLKFAAEKNIIVEINTKKYSVASRFFPDESFFRFMNEEGIQVVVNSDSHRPELINDGRIEALHSLKRNGYVMVYEMHGGSWKDIPIH